MNKHKRSVVLTTKATERHSEVTASQSKLQRSKTKAKNFWDEFKSFAIKGSVVDLAVGLVIGTAFNDLVKSLVANIIMPPIGKLIGNVDFSNLYFGLTEKSYPTLAAAEAAGVPVIKYGAFISSFLDFFIMALSLFVVLKIFLRYKFEERKDGK